MIFGSFVTKVVCRLLALSLFWPNMVTLRKSYSKWIFLSWNLSWCFDSKLLSQSLWLYLRADREVRSEKFNPNKLKRHRWIEVMWNCTTFSIRANGLDYPFNNSSGSGKECGERKEETILPECGTSKNIPSSSVQTYSGRRRAAFWAHQSDTRCLLWESHSETMNYGAATNSLGPPGHRILWHFEGFSVGSWMKRAFLFENFSLWNSQT